MGKWVGLLTGIVFLLFSCSKTETDPLPLQEWVGTYCGGGNFFDSGTFYNNTIHITLSPNDEEKIILDGFNFTLDVVEAIVEGHSLIIEAQTARTYYRGEYYYFPFEGWGEYDPATSLLMVEIKRKDEPTERNFLLEANNYKHYKATGNYKGANGNEVIIVNTNDSLQIEVICYANDKQYHWKNISGIDHGCGISISEQQVLEINSGEIMTLNGGAHKNKYSLDVFIYITPSTDNEISNFTVDKD